MGFNTILPMKVVVHPEFYLCGDVGTYEIYGEATHAFISGTYIKYVFYNTKNIFETMINKYGSPLEGVYHP